MNAERSQGTADRALLAPDGYVAGYSSKIPRAECQTIFSRVRAGEKSRHIAREYNVHRNTISRIVRLVAKDLGVYDPAAWTEKKRERRKASWEQVKEMWDHRDQVEVEDARRARVHQEAIERETERIGREQRRRLQRALNERNRRRLGM